MKMGKEPGADGGLTQLIFVEELKTAGTTASKEPNTQWSEESNTKPIPTSSTSVPPKTDPILGILRRTTAGLSTFSVTVNNGMKQLS